MNRELIFSTLFARLSGAADFKTTGRRLIHWSKVTEQPALFVVEGVYQDYPAGLDIRPRLIEIEARAWLYSNASKNPDIPPAQELNGLMDAVERALLSPDPFRRPQTLGLTGVTHCRLQGRLVINPGHLGNQAVAIMPVVIQVAEGL